MTHTTLQSEDRNLAGLQLLQHPTTATAHRSWRLWPVSSGFDDVFMDLFDVEAHLTWAEGLRGTEGGHAAASARLIVALLRHFGRLPATGHTRLATPDSFGPGVVVLLRTQKLVVLDRLRDHVYQVLRDDCDDKGLLEREKEANIALPSKTIPVLDSQFSRRPYFLIQPYVAFRRTPGWRQLLPHMRTVIGILFQYYESFGFEAVEAPKYVADLAGRVMQRLEDDEIGRLARRLIDRCRTEAERRPGLQIVLTRVHGDFIPAHVVWPRGTLGPGPLLIDWSESWRYSLVHDLFYLHFQNYDSDFCGQLPGMSEPAFAAYFGAGYETLRQFVAQRLALDLSGPIFRLNLLVCFLEELDHRVNRLAPQFLPFWAQQTRRLDLAIEARGGLC